MTIEEEVKEYYTRHWSQLVQWWKSEETLGIHYGYHKKGIHNHVQSIFAMNDFVGKLLGLDADDKKKILDAGCGVGGTSIYLAKKYPHVDFKGITISSEQVKLANQFASRVSNVEFLLKDFADTGFPNGYFDGAFALESICYAKDKRAVIREMHRILKPGGKLVIIDGFRTDVQLNNFMRKIYNIWLKGRSVPNLEFLETFIAYLKMEGFKEIEERDLSKNIRFSAIRSFFIGIPYLFYVVAKKTIMGRKYEPTKDTCYCIAVSVLSPIFGLNNIATYNAISAVKK
jgi:ubiquinone/menaquinone biosynthesis C-methylase UbiE